MKRLELAALNCFYARVLESQIDTWNYKNVCSGCNNGNYFYFGRKRQENQLIHQKICEVLVLRQQQVTFTKMLLSVNLSIIFLHNYKVDK